MSIHISSSTILRLLDIKPGPGLRNNVNSYRGDSGLGMRNPLLEKFLDDLLAPNRDGIPDGTVDLLTAQLVSADPRMDVTERQLRAEAIQLLRRRGHDVPDEPTAYPRRSLILDDDPRSLVKTGWR